MPFFPLVLCQARSKIGAIDDNVRRILLERELAAQKQARLLIMSELFLSGYPAEDLLLNKSFLQDINQAITQIAHQTRTAGPAVLLGTPMLVNDKCYNAALLIDNGAVRHLVYKKHLPNYGPFDEKRVFDPSDAENTTFVFDGVCLHVLICEDLWHEDRTAIDADMIIAINASPYQQGKQALRLKTAARVARQARLPLVYTNLVGGQDELLFDGGSFVVDRDGSCQMQMPQWQEGSLVVQYEKKNARLVTDKAAAAARPLSPPHCDYQALLCGIKDYCHKNACSEVVIGLSGGIDSALVAVLASDSLGANNVYAFCLPSPYTEQTSLDNAMFLAKSLSCHLHIESIDDVLALYRQQLPNAEQGSVTEQNLQARIRATYLMAIANLRGALLLATGNKSEYAMGYATLYGDMAGTLAPLKDVYKTHVYALANWRQHHQPHAAAAVQPFNESLLTRAPSAELKPNQKDSDDLPDYALLDAVLVQLLEHNIAPTAIKMPAISQDHIIKLWRRLISSEYKRRQAPPGLRVTSCLFGRDRRYPLTTHYQP